jgi:AcrR family transcriptional regulator
MNARHLSTAEDRQEQVVEAAMGVFAERGFRGATTAEVARAAGISQAYVHKLFPTKADLSLAVARRCFVKTEATFREAGTRAKAGGEDVLEAMGHAYAELVADPTSLLVQQHSFAAAATDPAVREAVRDGFAQLYALVSGLSGASDEEVQAWFAQGMLINVLMAIDAPSVDEPWAKALVGE